MVWILEKKIGDKFNISQGHLQQRQKTDLVALIGYSDAE
jgi:hypothetical protein